MKLSLNRFDSETVRASIEGYKQKFPLPDRLSNKNTLVDVYIEYEDDVATMQTLAHLVSQSHVALIVLHMAKVNVGGQLTTNGEELLEAFKDAAEKRHYQYIGGAKERVWVFGMLHPGLVYTE